MKDNTASVLCQVPVEVASFLLNEKRTEIAKIELKQRINVLLVPNKTMETPHYKLERLKHDDPRLDRIEASYTMAEEIEDPTTVTRRSQERQNKQEPVIKGVLPDAPAPVAPPKVESAPAQPVAVVAPAAVVPAAEKGFLGWIKSLFGAPPAAPLVASPTVAAPVQPARDEARREGRNGRGGRDGERRDGRRSEGRNDGRSDGRRGERRPDTPGENRGERDSRRGNGRSEGRGEPRDGETRTPRAERGERNGARERREAMAPAMEANVTDGQTPVTVDSGELRRERQPRPERSEVRRERGGERAERGEARRERTERPAARSEDDTGRPEDLNPAVAEPATQFADEALVGQTAPNDTTAEGDNTRVDGGERRERRSRDRYGRDRRNGNREPRQPSDTDADAGGSVTGAEVAEPATETTPAGDERARRSYFDRPSVAVTPSVQEIAAAENAEAKPFAAPEPMATAPAPAVDVSPIEATTPKMAVEASVAPVVADAPMPTPPSAPSEAAPPFVLPMEGLTRIAQGSGLQWVNSDADKVAAVQAAIAAEPRPVLTPRERPPSIVVDEGPLVLVETRKDLRNLNLPF